MTVYRAKGRTLRALYMNFDSVGAVQVGQNVCKYNHCDCNTTTKTQFSLFFVWIAENMRVYEY